MKKSFLRFQNISDSYSQVNIFPQMSKAQEYEGCNLYVVAFSPLPGIFKQDNIHDFYFVCTTTFRKGFSTLTFH